MDHMLRKDKELEWPDLMLIMVRHWLDLQRSTRVRGTITIHAFVTHIADRLEVLTASDELCKGPIALDAEAFCLAKFITIQRGTACSSDKYFLCTPHDSTRYQMPFPASLSFEDRST